MIKVRNYEMPIKDTSYGESLVKCVIFQFSLANKKTTVLVKGFESDLAKLSI